MADIKNYGLVGVGSSVQFGKGGAQIIQAAESFSLKTKNGDSLVNLSIANPTADEHAVNKGFLDDLFNSLNTARIRDDATNPTAQVATDLEAGKVVIQATTGSALSTVATFQSGVGGDTSVLFDNTNNGELAITAVSSANDASVHLVPQGDGAVILGAVDADALMQAEPTRNLTLAGGDSSDTTAAGSLILRAGSGSTAGQVVIMGSHDDVLLAFQSGDGSNNQLTATNGTTSYQLAVSGTETDIDIKLAPKGAGVVDVSGAKVANVAAGVQDTDAVNVGQLNTAVTSIQETIQSNYVGSLQTRVGVISTSTNNIGVSLLGRVRKVTVNILTAYSAGTEITVGSASAPDSLLSSGDLDETSTGFTEVVLDQNYSSETQLIATISGAPTTGSARITIEYIQG